MLVSCNKEEIIPTAEENNAAVGQEEENENQLSSLKDLEALGFKVYEGEEEVRAFEAEFGGMSAADRDYSVLPDDYEIVLHDQIILFGAQKLVISNGSCFGSNAMQFEGLQKKLYEYLPGDIDGNDVDGAQLNTGWWFDISDHLVRNTLEYTAYPPFDWDLGYTPITGDEGWNIIETEDDLTNQTSQITGTMYRGTAIYVQDQEEGRVGVISYPEYSLGTLNPLKKDISIYLPSVWNNCIDKVGVVNL